jgi:hypothetical protein
MNSAGARANRIAWLSIIGSVIVSILFTFVGHSAFGEDVLDIATNAYIYGSPLVTMNMTRRAFTNVAEPRPADAPIDQFARLRTNPVAITILSQHLTPVCRAVTRI